MTTFTDLPTVEEAREFLRVINAGRVAIGAEPLAKLDFDGAEPNEGHACLSATNLFSLIGEHAGSQTVENLPPQLAQAIGAERYAGATAGDSEFVIPDEIRVVTDPFDMKVEGLRERLVEAGVVEE